MMNLDVNNDRRKQRVLRQMDLDYSLSQMIQLCISPTKVYKMTAWRKQTKNQWARDDPSFIVITLFFTAVIALAYTVALQPLQPVFYLKSLVQSVLFTILFSLIIATVIWYFVNHYMRNQRPHSPEQFVEWLYSIDIHFNSLIPVIVVEGVIQYLCLPFLLKTGWLPTILSGLFVLVSIIGYCFISFLGYMYLPFIKTPYFIFGVGGILCCIVLIMVACGVNFTQFWISRYYFPGL